MTPRLEVKEYPDRPGAFYIAVGDHGRWIIDDREEAEKIVELYNRWRQAELRWQEEDRL